MRTKTTQRVDKDTLRLLIKSLKNNDKVFIEIESYNIPKTIHGDLLSQSYGLYVNDKNNEILLVKFCGILTYLCRENNKTIKEIIIGINDLDSNNNLTETDVYKYNSLNNRFIDAFKNNRNAFEMFRYILKNGVYNATTLLYYWDWMNKHHILEDIDIEKALLEITNGGKLNDILKHTSATMLCDKCRKVKSVTDMRIGKNICKECDKIVYGRKSSINSAETNSVKKKKSKEISMQLENKIEKFKSNEQTFSTEVQHSRNYLMYEAMHSTIINNLYDIIDLELADLSDEEKEALKVNNEQIIKLLREVEEKTWEQ